MWPHDFLTSTDCRNAFGCAHMAPELALADEDCPQIRRLLRDLWTDVDTIVIIRAGKGGYGELHVRDGFGKACAKSLQVLLRCCHTQLHRIKQ